MFQVWRKRLTSITNAGFLYYAILIFPVVISVQVVRQIISTPYAGLDWIYPSGEIYNIAPGTEAWGILTLEDKIISVDGFSPKEGLIFPGKQIGDPVEFIIQRDNLAHSVTLELIAWPFQTLIGNLAPLAIGLSFWLVALIIVFWGQAKSTNRLLSLFLVFMSLILSTGTLSGLGIPWAVISFRLFMWIIGPLTLHTHARFIGQAKTKFFQKMLLFSYGFAILFGLLQIWITTYNSLIVSVFKQFVYGWIALHLLVVIIMLIRGFYTPQFEEGRYRMGILTLGISISFALFIATDLAPRIFSQELLFPNEFTFLSLLIIPASYGYAIFRQQLIPIEQTINRSAVVFIVGTFLITIYSVLHYTFYSTQILGYSSSPLIGLVITLILVAIAMPMFRATVKFVDQILYGGWYDYQSAVGQITETMTSFTDSENHIAAILTQSLAQSIKLKYCNLLLSDGIFSSYSADKQKQAQVSRLDWKLIGPLFETNKCQNQRISNDPGINMVDVLTPTLRQQVLGSEPQRVVPLISKDRCLGLYILGDKIGRDPIDSQDNQILEVVIRQASIILENHFILEQNHQLHLQVLEAREDERKRVARDLHDQIIQALINMVFQVEELSHTVKSNELTDLLDKLRDTLDQTRDICTDLRPSALDIFGLGPAIQSRISSFEEQYPCQVIFREKKTGPGILPDETRLCLYRFFQEALMNVQKHSQATQVFVILSYEPDQVSLTIRDNGKGFSIPSHLTELTRDQHFGLVGIQELLNIINGVLEIEASPGEGCLIKAIVPVETRSFEVSSYDIIQQRM